MQASCLYALLVLTLQLLVLGRPGSGCTSLLNVLSNSRDSFDEVIGETFYGSMDHKTAKKYRQQIIFNTEGIMSFSNCYVPLH